MKPIDRFNPTTKEDLARRKEFLDLPEEEQKEEKEKLKERANIENTESFYSILEREEGVEQREDLELALEVCERVKEGGGLALVVGGFARDTALNKFGYNLKPKDIDIEVYGLEFEKLESILSSLGDTNVVGASFGVIKLKGLDVSIPRRDSKTGRGHKGFKIEGDPEMLVREAAQRRDFTINALALNPLTGEILDFYGGIEDIKNRTLRMVDKETFADDPLRVLRAMQFGARFGFNVEQETVNLCRTLDLKELSKERIGEEYLKLLLKAEKPSIGLELARKLGVLEQLHPEIEAMVGVPQDPEHHPEGDVWTHIKLVIDAARDIAEAEALSSEDKKAFMLAALCHDLGKPATTKTEENGSITSYGHEAAGLEPAEGFMGALNIDKKTAEKVLILVKHHMFIHNTPEPTDSAIRRLARRLYPVTIRELALLATADKRGTTLIKDKYPQAEYVLKRAEELAVKDAKSDPLIMGRDLLAIGFKPGKIIGEILREVEELQLDGKVNSRQEAIAYVRDNFQLKIESHKPVTDSIGWKFEILEKTGDRLKIRHNLEKKGTRGHEKVENEIAVYERIYFDDINGPFYIQNKDLSYSGALPHGNAAYLREWDVILLSPYVFTSNILDKYRFTILAHELGHRNARKRNKTGNDQMDEALLELDAWMQCKKDFAEHPKFDIEEVESRITEYREIILGLEKQQV